MKVRLFAMGVVLLALAQSAQAQNALTPITAARAIELFKTLCADPFPDSQRFVATMAATPAFEKMPDTPGQPQQPGGGWLSQEARVTYAAGDWLPRDLPSPQCTVTVSLDSPLDHPALATAFGTALGLPATRVKGKGARQESQWDMPGEGNDKRRIFLTTNAGLPSGNEARFSLLNLRGRKK